MDDTPTTYSTADERRGFEAAIAADPHEATSRLAFADWLEEQGGTHEQNEAAFQRSMAEWVTRRPHPLTMIQHPPGRAVHHPLTVPGGLGDATHLPTGVGGVPFHWAGEGHAFTAVGAPLPGPVDANNDPRTWPVRRHEARQYNPGGLWGEPGEPHMEWQRWGDMEQAFREGFDPWTSGGPYDHPPAPAHPDTVDHNAPGPGGGLIGREYEQPAAPTNYDHASGEPLARALAAAHDDHTGHLVFADWLDEHHPEVAPLAAHIRGWAHAGVPGYFGPLSAGLGRVGRVGPFVVRAAHPFIDPAEPHLGHDFGNVDVQFHPHAPGGDEWFNTGLQNADPREDDSDLWAAHGGFHRPVGYRVRLSMMDARRLLADGLQMTDEAAPNDAPEPAEAYSREPLETWKAGAPVAYGRLPRAALASWLDQSSENGIFDANSSSDHAFADWLEDHGDPRAELVRRDLVYRQHPNGYFAGQKEHQTQLATAPQLPKRLGHGCDRVRRLSDGTRVETNHEPDGTYHVVWHGPGGAYVSMMTGPEVDALHAQLDEDDQIVHPDDAPPTPAASPDTPVAYGGADQSQVADMLAQLASAEHGPTRWGEPHGDHTLRGVAADALQDSGRDQEAEWLRSGRHVLVTPEGAVRPGRFTHEHVQNALEDLDAFHQHMGGDAPGDFIRLDPTGNAHDQTDFFDPNDHDEDFREGPGELPPHHVRVVVGPDLPLQAWGTHYHHLGDELSSLIGAMFDPHIPDEDAAAAHDDLHDQLVNAPTEEEDPTAAGPTPAARYDLGDTDTSESWADHAGDAPDRDYWRHKTPYAEDAAPVAYALTPGDLHPRLRHTRLGALLLRHANSSTDEAATLAREIALSDPHETYIDNTKFMGLQDWLLEHPEHPLAQSFRDGGGHLLNSFTLDQLAHQALTAGHGGGPLTHGDVVDVLSHIRNHGLAVNVGGLPDHHTYNSLVHLRTLAGDVPPAEVDRSLSRLRDQAAYEDDDRDTDRIARAHPEDADPWRALQATRRNVRHNEFATEPAYTDPDNPHSYEEGGGDETDYAHARPKPPGWADLPGFVAHPKTDAAPPRPLPAVAYAADPALDAAGADRARRVDLVILPDGVAGTNCGNCRYFRNNHCGNVEVDLPVSEHMCCALWDAAGTEHVGRTSYAEEDAPVPYSGADQATVDAFLAQLAHPDNRFTRWGGHHDPDMNLRDIAADALQDQGRDQEAAWLRDPHQHIVVEDGQVKPGRFTAKHAFDALSALDEAVDLPEVGWWRVVGGAETGAVGFQSPLTADDPRYIHLDDLAFQVHEAADQHGVNGHPDYDALHAALQAAPVDEVDLPAYQKATFVPPTEDARPDAPVPYAGGSRFSRPQDPPGFRKPIYSDSGFLQDGYHGYYLTPQRLPDGTAIWTMAEGQPHSHPDRGSLHQAIRRDWPRYDQFAWDGGTSSWDHELRHAGLFQPLSEHDLAEWGTWDDPTARQLYTHLRDVPWDANARYALADRLEEMGHPLLAKGHRKTAQIDQDAARPPHDHPRPEEAQPPDDGAQYPDSHDAHGNQYDADAWGGVHYAARPAPDAIHPELRNTRLGAYLREVAAQDSDVGAHARALLASDPTAPLDGTALLSFIDHIHDADHPLVNAFNWSTLPRSLAADRAFRGELGIPGPGARGPHGSPFMLEVADVAAGRRSEDRYPEGAHSAWVLGQSGMAPREIADSAHRAFGQNVRADADPETTHQRWFDDDYDDEAQGHEPGWVHRYDEEADAPTDYARTDYSDADEQAGFEHAIDANPFEAITHGAYADWLQDRGHDDEAAFRRAMADWLGRRHEHDQPELRNDGWGIWSAPETRPWFVRGHFDEGAYPAGVRGVTSNLHGVLVNRFGAMAGDPLPHHGVWEVGPPAEPEFGVGWRTYRDMESALRESFHDGLARARHAEAAQAPRTSREWGRDADPEPPAEYAWHGVGRPDERVPVRPDLTGRKRFDAPAFTAYGWEDAPTHHDTESNMSAHAIPPEWGTAEPPSGPGVSVPSVNWNHPAVDDRAIASRAEWYGGGVHRLWVPLSSLPDTADTVRIEEEVLQDEDPDYRYPWEQFDEDRGGMPPVFLVVNRAGRLTSDDGAHRLHWLRGKGYTHVPAYLFGASSPRRRSRNGAPPA